MKFYKNQAKKQRRLQSTACGVATFLQQENNIFLYEEQGELATKHCVSPIEFSMSYIYRVHTDHCGIAVIFNQGARKGQLD